MVPEGYPGELPKAYAFGWEATYENTFHHRWGDGTICYGREKENPQLARQRVRLKHIIELLDDYVAGMLQWRLTGRWSNGKGRKE